MSPWKVILATMVIFCCGVVTGALVIKTAFPPQPAQRGPGPPPGSRPFAAQIQNTNFLHRIQGQLALTPDQTSEIEKDMMASQARSEALWKSIEPDIQRELNLVRAEILQVLNPDQQKKFTDMLAASRPRRPDGTPPREGDSFPRSRTNHFHTNGLSSNAIPPLTAPVPSATNGT